MVSQYLLVPFAIDNSERDRILSKRGIKHNVHER